jgi:glycosylphosphatidylinositol phospholipase D
MARFGSTLVVLDWNLDGIDDLAVGAPGWSGWNTSDAAASPFPLNGDPTYRNYGRVFVYLGSKGSGLQVAAPIVLTTSNVFTGLGWALAAADVTSDGHSDLLLGCPQANDWDGRVLALAATTARVAGAVLDVDAPGVAALDLSGKASAAEFGAGWFGASVAVSAGDAPSAPPLLLVGAPYSRHNLRCSQECEIVGRVFGFALASHDAALPKPFNTSAAIFSIFGEDPLGRMGASVATTMAGASGGVAGGELVALGIPGAGATRMGKIALINAASLPSLRGDVSLASLEPTTARMLLGDVEQGRLGSTLIFADVTADGQPDLITSAPHENGKSGLHIPFDQRELGSVYVFDRAELLCWSRHWLTSSASTNNATWAHKGTRARGRLGASVAALNQSCMLVGSPRASAESPYIMEGNGAVDILCVH